MENKYLNSLKKQLGNDPKPILETDDDLQKAFKRLHKMVTLSNDPQGFFRYMKEMEDKPIKDKDELDLLKCYNRQFTCQRVGSSGEAFEVTEEFLENLTVLLPGCYIFRGVNEVKGLSVQYDDGLKGDGLFEYVYVPIAEDDEPVRRQNQKEVIDFIKNEFEKWKMYLQEKYNKAMLLAKRIKRIEKILESDFLFDIKDIIIRLLLVDEIEEKQI